MKKSSALFSCIILGFLYCSCSRKLASIKPPTTEYEQYHLPPSVINLPIEIRLSFVDSILNNHFHGLLYEDADLHNNGDDNLLLKIWKIGNIKVNVEGNALRYTIPIKIWAKGGFNLQRLGLGLSNYQESQCSLMLSFKSVIDIDSNWVLYSDTWSQGFEWIEKPYIKFGIFKVPVGWAVESTISEQQQHLAALLDKQIIANGKLQKFVASAWQQILKPMQLHTNPQLWLSIQPVRVSYQPLSGASGKLLTTLSVKAYFRTDTIIKASNKLANLPHLHKDALLTSGSSISILVNIPYQDAVNFIKPHLIGLKYQFKGGRRTVAINDISLYPNRGNLITKLTIGGDIAGTLYLKGIPYFDSLSSSIKLASADFDIESKNILVKSAGWLAHSDFVQKINNNLAIPIKPYLDEAKKALEQNLNKRDSISRMILESHITHLAPQKIVLSENTLGTIVEIKGHLKLKFPGRL